VECDTTTRKENPVQASKLTMSLCVAAAVAVSGSALGKGGGGGGGGGGHGGGANVSIGTDLGLYLVDNPFPGEAAISGWVLARLTTGTIPADFVVTINGVRLVHPPGMASLIYVVDPNGPQPSVGADNKVHIVASSASNKASRQLDLTCPARAVVATSPGIGSNLGNVGQLDMAWTALPQNTNYALIGHYIPYPTATLSSYDLATGAPMGTVSQATLDQTSTGTSLPVAPGAGTGYVVELAYPGVHVTDEQDAGGWCGRKQRYLYMR
jgi:hypothetical protein